MNLNTLDFTVIGCYFIMVIGIGIYFSKRAGRSMEDFFLSGRKLPWWVAGTSLAATGFAADTPFMVTELVRRNGIAGNWFLWCFAMSNLCATFCSSASGAGPKFSLNSRLSKSATRAAPPVSCGASRACSTA